MRVVDESLSMMNVTITSLGLERVQSKEHEGDGAAKGVSAEGESGTKHCMLMAERP